MFTPGGESYDPRERGGPLGPGLRGFRAFLEAFPARGYFVVSLLLIFHLYVMRFLSGDLTLYSPPRESLPLFSVSAVERLPLYAQVGGSSPAF